MKNPFKVGDSVTCVNAIQDLIEGYEYTVSAIWQDMVALNGSPKWFYASRFEKTGEMPQKTKFKVGDYVVCIDDKVTDNAIEQGKIYLVTELPSRQTIKLDGVTKGPGFFNQNRFIRRDMTIEESGFQVGDKVKCIRPDIQENLISNHIYTIKTIDPHWDLVFVDGINKGFVPSRFIKVESDNTTEVNTENNTMSNKTTRTNKEVAEVLLDLLKDRADRELCNHDSPNDFLGDDDYAIALTDALAKFDYDVEAEVVFSLSKI